MTTKPSWWPTVVEIYAALARTDSCFDPWSTLYQATPKNRDTLGKPTPSAVGQGSMVYHFETSQRDHLAVIVFRNGVTDHENRYGWIQNHIRHTSAPNFLQFSYRPDEFIVSRDGRAQRFPLLVMQWTSEPTLDAWVEQNLNSPGRLLRLAYRFRTAHFALGSRQIAHGDLHPWNIAIKRSAPEIIWLDYFPLYVPGLHSFPPPDLGIETFQHPDRFKSRYWGPNVDAFPARVIYLSLLVLAHAPAVWDKFHVPDENLIFCSHDFASPGKTALWKEILSIKDHHVRFMAQDLMRACETPLSLIPRSLPLN